MSKNTQYPLKGIADQLASKGRFGDSVLVHMNPAEVQGLAALSPTGKLTINPETGQQEAFLPMLVPILASMGGTAAAGAMGMGALGTAAMGGLASGVATGAMTGDWERGLTSGLLGAGMGAALGAAAGNAADAAGQAAAGSQAATDIASQQGLDILSQNSDVLANAGNAMQPASVTGGAESMLDAAGSGVQAFQMPGATGGMGGTFGQRFGQALKAPFQKGSGLGSELMKKEAFLPISMGASGLAQYEAQDSAMGRSAAMKRKREEEKARARSNLNSAYREAQPGMGFAGGGTIHMPTGGAIRVDGGGYNPYGPRGAGPNVEEFQNNLRGRYNVSGMVPYDYMPGFNREIDYFQNTQTPDFGSYSRGPYGWSSMYNHPYQSPINRFLAPNRHTPTWWPYQANPQPYFGNTMPQQQQGGGGKGGSTGGGGGKGGSMGGSSMGGGKGGSYGGDPAAQFGGAATGTQQMAYAEGGQASMPLETPSGPAQIAPGGLADVPNDVARPAHQKGPRPDEVKEVAMAIAGAMGDQGQRVVDAFIQRHGIEVFRKIREMVLQSIQPGSRTEGMIEGEGGGMDDQVGGTIGAGQPVAVSPGEYIVPADVVSGLGDGSSEAGAKELDRMLTSVRKARGGTADQPPAINAREVMPG